MKRKIYLGLLLFVSASSVFANTVIQRHTGQITAAETVAKVKVSFPYVEVSSDTKGTVASAIKNREDTTLTPTISPLQILHNAPYNCTFKNVSVSAGNITDWSYKDALTKQWMAGNGSMCAYARTLSGVPQSVQGYMRYCAPGDDFTLMFGLRMINLSMEAEIECGESPVGKVTSQSMNVLGYMPTGNESSSIQSHSTYSVSYSYSNIVTGGITLNYTINEVKLTERNTPVLLLDAKFDENSASKSGYVSLSPVNRNLASDMLHISRQDTGEQLPLDNTEVRFEDAIKLDVSTKTTGKHDIPLLVTLGLD
ncbi:hypothetical protein [Escherichia coli]|uniref:hypothetical protein n=1 Tax=Escherichia coli TaxID=562 RepID=UPI0002A36867|nr:hypothetical protein [Escherichia coli]ELF95371.1 hypothetical protein A1S5_04637 [Escherichia coli KTE48]